MNTYKYIVSFDPNRTHASPVKLRQTKLNTEQKFERLPVELRTFLDDKSAEVSVTKINPTLPAEAPRLLVVTTSQLQGEVDAAVGRCARGLDLDFISTDD